MPNPKWDGSVGGSEVSHWQTEDESQAGKQSEVKISEAAQKAEAGA
jgi:hypothetical protein